MTPPSLNLAVVGAGPAGLAAATAAAEAGLRVALIDAGGRPGGQFWRHADPETVPDQGREHHGWRTFTDLRRRLDDQVRAGRVDYLPRQQVWSVARHDDKNDAGRPSFTLRLTPAFHDPTSPTPARTVTSRAVALCPGGYDRQLPVPGWTLPGVMAAGGVQALLKEHRTLAGRRAVVAGTGPFLLPVAAGLARAGAEVRAVCEAHHPVRWLRHPPPAALLPAKAAEGAGYAAALARHRVPYHTRTVVSRVHGDREADGVTLDRVDAHGRILPGHARHLTVDLVALGWGFTPSLELVTAVGARTTRGRDGSLVAAADRVCRSSVPGVYVAGEATGVGGADKAVAEGELAGLTAAVDQGRPAPRARGRRLARRIARADAFAAAMHRAHPVPERWADWLTPDTTLCRCEEVSVGAVTRAQDEWGAGDPRTAKMLARPGMGWCQGRVCGYATAALLATRAGREPTTPELAATTHRPLATPIPLADLAALPDPDGADPDTDA